MMHDAGGGGAVCGPGGGQRLKLVHFSAQPKPFRSHLPVSPYLIDCRKIMHPTYPTKCAYVEPKSGRALAPGGGPRRIRRRRQAAGGAGRRRRARVRGGGGCQAGAYARALFSST